MAVVRGELPWALMQAVPRERPLRCAVACCRLTLRLEGVNRSEDAATVVAVGLACRTGRSGPRRGRRSRSEGGASHRTVSLRLVEGVRAEQGRVMNRCGLGCASCSCPALSSEGVGGPGEVAAQDNLLARGGLSLPGRTLIFSADTSRSERYCTQLGAKARNRVPSLGILEAGKEERRGRQVPGTTVSKGRGRPARAGMGPHSAPMNDDGPDRAIECFIGAFRVGWRKALATFSCLPAPHTASVPIAYRLGRTQEVGQTALFASRL